MGESIYRSLTESGGKKKPHPASCGTHTHTRAVSHTAVPLGNPKLCCSPLHPWIWPLFLQGKYPLWPDTLNHSLGKSPALLVLAWISGCYMAQQYNVCACKWLRRHLHLVPLRVCGYACMCWCFFLFCCVCVCTQKYQCVSTWRATLFGIGIRYSLADWDSAGKSQGQLLIRRKKGGNAGSSGWKNKINIPLDHSRIFCLLPSGVTRHILKRDLSKKATLLNDMMVKTRFGCI